MVSDSERSLGSRVRDHVAPSHHSFTHHFAICRTCGVIHRLLQPIYDCWLFIHINWDRTTNNNVSVHNPRRMDRILDISWSRSRNELPAAFYRSTDDTHTRTYFWGNFIGSIFASLGVDTIHFNIPKCVVAEAQGFNEVDSCRREYDFLFN